MQLQAGCETGIDAVALDIRLRGDLMWQETFQTAIEHAVQPAYTLALYPCPPTGKLVHH